ncbi:MAG: ABC transporter ATP-binding protein [Thermincola sp.]|jgi:ABC-type oligopeptide transport system ATPase subunit|nr:ABC transporter ATP-binding protein [Thermincola sp.]MDT3702799.1 ABC transporter ATP-binding protein [Thermincola sp.]
MEDDWLIEVSNLSKVFTFREGFGRQRLIRAVDNVSFYLGQGETVALIGESGSGKTTVGRIILGLTEPTAGRVIYKGREVKAFTGKGAKAFRRTVQAVFQDPNMSLNPRMTVQEIIAEPLKNFGQAGDYIEETAKLLNRVGLGKEFGIRYPHQCSGGQKQRIAIARALALKPELVVLDEPLSSLDIAVQVKIIALLRELKEIYGMSYLFITHDLKAVSALADRVVVMYRGVVVETAETKGFMNAPVHPHSRALLKAIPKLDS